MSNIFSLQIKKYLFLIIIAIVVCSGNMLAGKYGVYPLPLQKLFPSISVNDIYRDSRGYLWICTENGVCRTDGHSVKTFHFNTVTGERLRNNNTGNISEDNHGRLWICSKNGCFIIDPQNGYKVYCPDEMVKKNEIKWIEHISGNKTLLAMNNKILVFDDNTDLQKEIVLNLKDGKYPNQIVESRDGRIFIVMPNNSVHQLDLERGVVNSYRFNNAGGRMRNMMQDPDNSYFWICCENGIYRFNPDEVAENNVYVPCVINSAEASMSKLLIDNKKHNMWVVSPTDIYVYKIADGMLQKLDVFGDDIDWGFYMPRNVSILNERYIAVSSYNGNSQIVDCGNRDSRFFNISSSAGGQELNSAVNTLCRTDKETVFVSTEGHSLMAYNISSGNVVDKLVVKDNNQNIKIEVGDMERSMNDVNRIWFTNRIMPTLYSAYLDDGFIVVDHVVNFESGRRCSIADDKNGNLYVNDTKRIYHFNTETLEKKLLVSNLRGMKKMVFDRTSNILWINCPTIGVLKISDPLGKRECVMFPQKKIVTDIAYNQGLLYMSTEDGCLYAMDNSGKIRDLTDIVKWEGDKFSNIRKDNQGHIWILSNRRLIEYVPGQNISLEYSTSCHDIPIEAFIPNAISSDNNGNILAGGFGGFGIFKSTQNVPDKTESVVVTDIISEGKSLMFKDGAITDDGIYLDYTEKNVEIQLSTLEPIGEEQKCYAYRIDDSKWEVLNKGDNKIHLYLNKGKHKLELAYRNNVSKWIRMPKPYVIVREPAIYETTAANVTYVFVVIVLLGIGIFYYRKRLIKRNEKELARSMEDFKFRYLTNVSHDLLTPLAIMSCAADNLNDSEENLHFKHVIRDNVFRLRNMLQQVIDFRKMEAGKMELNVAYGNLCEFVGSVVEKFNPLIENRNMVLEYKTEELLCGFFDRDKIEKILFNLLSNAIKYSDENGSIKVEVHSKDKGVEIIVEDTGCGISESELEKIFTPFYNNPKAEPGSSNGIGLSMCKQLVEMHHGTISVESKESVGSRFMVYIPLESSEYGVGADVSESENLVNDVAQEKSMLIVEDDKELLGMLGRIFEKEFNVYCASDGIIAYSIVASKDIDIIISDIAMPRMDGVELCRKVKADAKTSHIPIILLTAKVQAANKITGYDAGADSYMEKPFDSDVLKSRVYNLVNKNAQISKSVYDDQNQSLTLDEEFLDKILYFMKMHISDSCYDINSLSSDLCVSKSTLSRKVKAMTGKTASDYLYSIRMNEACRMIVESDRSISDISKSVSFDDSRYFSRRFKDFTGMTPTQYREYKRTHTDN